MSTTPSQFDTPVPIGGPSTRSGWANFVATYLVIVGVLNVIWGIVALANESYFVDGGLAWSTLETWGWIAIVVGAVQFLGGLLVASRHMLGAIIALLLAFIGVLMNFLAIGAYPIWSAILIAIDSLIIWAVTVHGDEFVS